MVDKSLKDLVDINTAGGILDDDLMYIVRPGTSLDFAGTFDDLTDYLQDALSITLNTSVTQDITITKNTPALLMFDTAGGSTNYKATVYQGLFIIQQIQANGSFISNPIEIESTSQTLRLKATGSTLGGNVIVTADTLGTLSTKSTVTNTEITANTITNANIRQSAALSLLGNATNSTANIADITAGTDGFVLRRSGTTLAFGTLGSSSIANSAITYAKIQNVGINSLFGNPTGSAAAGTDITLDATLVFATGALKVVDNTSTQKVIVLNNGSSVGTRKSINFIPGSNTTFTITDDSGNDRVNFTINSAGGAGTTTPGGSSGQLQYNNSSAFGGATALVYATSGQLLTSTAQTATDIPFTIKGAGSQSADLFDVRNSSNTIIAKIDSAGNFTGTNLSGTNTGDQTITLGGDLGGSGTSSITATIGNNKVTYAKFQAVAAVVLIGNPTGSSANASEISLGNTLTFVSTELRTTAMSGDITTSANSFVTSLATNAVTFAKFQQLTANTLVGNATGSTANATVITLGATLAFSSGVLQTAALTGDVTTSANSFNTTLTNNAVTDAKLRQGTANSVIGRANNSTGNVADIAASTNGNVLRLNGTTLGFGTLDLTAAGTVGSSILGGANGGTGNAFFAISGPATSLKTFTFPNASATVLTTNAAVTVAQGGTGGTTYTANALITGNGTSALQATGVTVSTNNEISGYRVLFNAQVGTTYTVVTGDSGKTLTFTNASAITVTCPNNMPVGWCVECIQTGAGQVTFSAGSGATINQASGYSKLTTQHSCARLVVITNSGGSSAVYNLAGDLTS